MIQPLKSISAVLLLLRKAIRPLNVIAEKLCFLAFVSQLASIHPASLKAFTKQPGTWPLIQSKF